MRKVKSQQNISLIWRRGTIIAKQSTKFKKNKIITDASEILKEEKHFYQNMYTSHKTYDEMDDNVTYRRFFAHDETIPKLTDGEKNQCEGQITEQELLDTLKSCQNGKSPGSDGFPAEFYKFFWSDIKSKLVKALNLAYQKPFQNQQALKEREFCFH